MRFLGFSRWFFSGCFDCCKTERSPTEASNNVNPLHPGASRPITHNTSAADTSEPSRRAHTYLPSFPLLPPGPTPSRSTSHRTHYQRRERH
jgi:hypothetical protein